jgi:hypothetical protein
MKVRGVQSGEGGTAFLIGQISLWYAGFSLRAGITQW